VGMHVNGEGGAAHGGCRRVERTEVVSAVGRWWQPQRLGGLGSSPYPPPPPSRSSPAAPVFVGKETNGLGRQTCRLRGLGCPPLRCHLDTYVVADGDARVTAWMPRGLSNSPSLFPSIAPSHAGEDPQPFHPSLGWRPGRH
jgi:hypothetical protein